MSQSFPSTDPDSVLYGAQTRLSVQNFGAPTRRLQDIPSFIVYYALIKQAAATANRDLGVLDDRRSDAIISACQEVASGAHLQQFPTALVLGGGGTTANMNLNEVIAARASQLGGLPVHPNDHVNASQSTNDTFPTAMALTLIHLAAEPIAALDQLKSALSDQAAIQKDTRYLGRTCLQDAVSLCAGHTLQAQAQAVDRCRQGLNASVTALSKVPLGATILGTGIGSPDGFGPACMTQLQDLIEFSISESEDWYDSLAHLDSYAAVADAAARAAITVAKIASDLRLRSSGPRGGFAEVTLPILQAGSSIMPAKANPVVPEYVMQLSYRIRGAAYTVSCAVAAGELELNIMEPIIIDSLINIFTDLERSCTTLATLCIKGLKWDGVRGGENLSSALDGWVSMAAKSGYGTASRARDDSTQKP